jgi:hypothetical protein
MTTSYNKIQEVINEWKPIEIYPLLYDEYKSEIVLIYKFIKASDLCNEETLGKYLYSVFKEWGGHIFDKSLTECEQIASLLLS